MAIEARDEGCRDGAEGGREWDVDAAFARIAGRSVAGFKAHLRELARDYIETEDLHLTFDKIQAAVGGSQTGELTFEQLAHVKDCRFCKELIDTVSASEAERDLFLDLVKQHERGPSSAEPMHGPASTPIHSSGVLAWKWPIATVASVAIVSAIGFATLQSAWITPYVDWTRAVNTCKTQGVPSCDLLTAAASLATDGQSHLARPVLVTALREAGVQEAALKKIENALATPPKSVPVREQSTSAQTPSVASTGSTPAGVPDSLLVSARQDFAAGESVRGYEQVASYIDVVADRPAAARALQLAFIEPVRRAQLLRARGTPFDAGKQTLTEKREP